MTLKTEGSSTSERTKIMHSLPSFYSLIPREEKCGLMRLELSKQKWCARLARTHTHTRARARARAHVYVCVFLHFLSYQSGISTKILKFKFEVSRLILQLMAPH